MAVNALQADQSVVWVGQSTIFFLSGLKLLSQPEIYLALWVKPWAVKRCFDYVRYW